MVIIMIGYITVLIVHFINILDIKQAKEKGKIFEGRIIRYQTTKVAAEVAKCPVIEYYCEIENLKKEFISSLLMRDKVGKIVKVRHHNKNGKIRIYDIRKEYIVQIASYSAVVIYTITLIFLYIFLYS